VQEFLRPVTDNVVALLGGMGTTLALSIVAVLLAIGVGLAIALIRIATIRPIRLIAWGSVDLIRGTPLIVQMYLLYYGLPSLGLRLDSFSSAALALGINFGAYISEHLRAAIAAVPLSEIEAAEALGLRRVRIIRRIYLPRAIPIALPALTNEVVDITKWSSVASIVVVSELTQVVGGITASTFAGIIPLSIVAAAFYLLLAKVISSIASRIESRLALKRASTARR
jgi:His/Glu/Gln/Arg/opine family amino acid ABC transporter permease subunit